MTTTIIVIAAVLLLIFLVTLKLGFGKKEARDASEADERLPIIHMSGIYSIVRKSPREDLAGVRPSEAQIRSYLDGITEDIEGRPLKYDDRNALVKLWKAQTEASLQEIEDGDRNSVAFYYYDYPEPCPVCAEFITRGNFVTREEIYKKPYIIPPFHLGCTCVLTAHKGGDSTLRDTVLVGMTPFLEGSGAEPSLPDWTNTVSLTEAKG